MKQILTAFVLSTACLVSQVHANSPITSPYATMPLPTLQAAAQAGNAHAQFFLANRYKTGQGVPQDMNQAFAWYLKAAEQGAAPAQLNIGQMYAQGRGVNRDLNQAKNWLQRAAKQGDNRASYNLALLEEREQNLSDAYKWYNVSTREGMLDPQVKNLAQNKIRQLAVNLSSQDQHDATRRADDWFQSPARQ
ncbi:MAG: tetratricopeptide repeat protein [Pseudomonadota bacterium]|nr:tetratricopeptide repeat protein [Pseudomonadota bacterium]